MCGVNKISFDPNRHESDSINSLTVELLLLEMLTWFDEYCENIVMNQIKDLRADVSRSFRTMYSALSLCSS